MYQLAGRRYAVMADGQRTRPHQRRLVRMMEDDDGAGWWQAMQLLELVQQDCAELERMGYDITGLESEVERADESLALASIGEGDGEE